MGGDVEPGMNVGGYRVESLIGRGGMGVVYLAEHVALGRRVALKVVAPELVRDEAFRDRFLREARLAASLEHPNIIPVYDAGDAGGVLYLAMRYVDGENLGDVIKREGALSVERTVDVLSKVAGALDEAHRNGLVHRDVKPDNVLLGASGSVFLTDFGLVRRLDAKTRLTRTGYMMGTLSYMAPEIFKNQEIDGRTDVYSLACVLFECLTGSPPYDREEQPAVITAHLLDAPPSVTEFRPGIPPGIDAVVSRGMAKEKEDRFPTTGQLIEAAASALSGPEEAVAAMPRSPRTLPTAPPLQGTEPSAPAPEPLPVAPPVGGSPAGGGREPPASRRWLPWLVIGAVLIAVAALAAPKLFERGTEPATGSRGTGTSETGTRDQAVELIATVAGTPATIDLDLDAVWVGSDDGTRGILSRIDAASGSVDPVDVGRRPVRLTFTGTPQDGSVWTANQADDTVSRVAVPLSDDPPATYLVGDGPVRFQSPEGSPFVWVANGEGHTLTRIDATVASVTDAVRTVLVGKDPRAISASPGSVASADHGDGTVSIVDAPSGVRVKTVEVGRSPSSILHVDPNLWVANAGDGTVSVVDPATGSEIHVIDVGSLPAGLTPDFSGSVWVRNEGDTTVSRLDIDRFRERAEIPVGGRPIAMAVTPGAIWVAVATGEVSRIDLDDGSVRPFELACRPASITSVPDPSTIGPELRGVWIACEDGSVLHIDADA